VAATTVVTTTGDNCSNDNDCNDGVVMMGDYKNGETATTMICSTDNNNDGVVITAVVATSPMPWQ